jgi:hypothetical protein
MCVIMHSVATLPSLSGSFHTYWLPTTFCASNFHFFFLMIGISFHTSVELSQLSGTSACVASGYQGPPRAAPHGNAPSPGAPPKPYRADAVWVALSPLVCWHYSWNKTMAPQGLGLNVATTSALSGRYMKTTPRTASMIAILQEPEQSRHPPVPRSVSALSPWPVQEA